MIVITGTGRSGTSYIAKMIHCLGYKTAGSNSWFFKINGGFEHRCIADIHNLCAAGQTKSASDMVKDLKGFKAVKSPQFVNRQHLNVIDLFEENYDLHVVLVHRDFMEAAKSFVRYKIPTYSDSDWDKIYTDENELSEILKQRYESFQNHLWNAGIDYTVISYERFMSDYDYAETKLNELLNAPKYKIVKVYNNVTVRK